MLYEGQILDWYPQQRGFGFEMWLIMKTVWNKKNKQIKSVFFFLYFEGK